MTRTAQGYPLPDYVMKASEFHANDEGYVNDSGYPMETTDGCPNCRRGAGWVEAGEDQRLSRPCSRKCALQLEYAESLRAARDEGHATATGDSELGRKAGSAGQFRDSAASASASVVGPRAEAEGGAR